MGSTPWTKSARDGRQIARSFSLTGPLPCLPGQIHATFLVTKNLLLDGCCNFVSRQSQVTGNQLAHTSQAVIVCEELVQQVEFWGCLLMVHDCKCVLRIVLHLVIWS